MLLPMGRAIRNHSRSQLDAGVIMQIWEVEGAVSRIDERAYLSERGVERKGKVRVWMGFGDPLDDPPNPSLVGQGKF